MVTYSVDCIGQPIWVTAFPVSVSSLMKHCDKAVLV